MSACVFVRVRKRESVCECVCICESEKEREVMKSKQSLRSQSVYDLLVSNRFKSRLEVGTLVLSQQKCNF